MKFKEITAEGFGCLKNWSTGNIENNLIVLYGRNETGKTTVFNLVTTILYGWKPASRDKNCYIPWNEQSASCMADILLKDGTEISVKRKLQSTSQGKLVRGNNSINLRNKPVPDIDILSRDIYAEIYALSIDNMRFPETNAWNSLQDQLLGGQFISFLNPVNKVVEDITKEANQLWREDRRGKPKSKKIRKRLNDLNKELKEAVKNEKILRETEASLSEKETKLAQIKEEKLNITTIINRAEKLAPVKKQLKRFYELKYLEGDIKKFKQLPDNPQKRLEDIRSELDLLKSEQVKLFNRKNHINKIISSYTEDESTVRNYGDEIRVLIKSYDQVENDMEQRKKQSFELESIEENLKEMAGEFIPGGWVADYESIVEIMDMVELRSGLRNFNRLNAEYNSKAMHVEGLKTHARQTRLPPFTPWLAAAVFISCMLGTIFGNNQLPAVIGGITATAIVLLWWYLNKKNDENIYKAEETLDKLKIQLNKIRSNVETTLNGLPFARDRLEIPDESIYVDINGIKNELKRKKKVITNINNIKQRLSKKEENIDSILESCGIEHKQYNLLEKINYIEVRLEEAERRFSKQQDAKLQLKDLEVEIDKVDGRINNLIKESNKIKAGIEPLKGSTVYQKTEELMQRRRYSQVAEDIMESLHTEYPDLDNIICEINNDSDNNEPELAEEYILRLKEKRDGTEKLVNELTGEISMLKKDIEHRMNKTKPDDINGEKKSLEEELEQSSVMRDKLILMRNILLEADRIYRDEHQPDVLKRAGEYLSVITGGRYNRIFITEGSQSELEVRSENNKEIILNYLSRGTCEQVYLALRLAMVDHLDPKEERLPLFLDEILVNWDGIRLKNGLKIIKELSLKRQVFLFTCHDWLAEKLASEYNARIINLKTH